MHRFALTLLVFAFVNCTAPARAEIPRGASAHWSIKDGVYHTWVRRTPLGCAAWSGNERWAEVQLVLESRCRGRREQGYYPGRGVSYLSVSDHFYFRGYWPWTFDDFYQTLVFGPDGMLSDMHPCPHTLPQDQIDALRALAQEALSVATTASERRVLTRVDQRLAATNGAALGAGQDDCTDLSPDITAPARAPVNMWVQD